MGVLSAMGTAAAESFKKEMSNGLQPGVNDPGVVVHRHDDIETLVNLLESHLPVALPTYSLLAREVKKPHTSITAYASFPEGEIPSKDDDNTVWIVLVDMETQLRMYCSAEAESDPSREVSEAAEVLICAALKESLSFHSKTSGKVTVPSGSDNDVSKSKTFLMGAVNARWIETVRNNLKPSYVAEYKVHLAAEDGNDSSLGKEAIKGEAVIHLAPQQSKSENPDRTVSKLPTNMIIGNVREEDIDQVLSTSEVKHLPSYIRSRLPESSAIFERDNGMLIAHCFTHRDGSMGTLHVSSSHRRLGLGRLVVEDRIRKDRFRAYCYVSKENSGSLALMRALEFQPAWEVAWIAVPEIE